MKKPIYKTPEYNITLPVSGKTVIFRPYNVGDERLLIIASTSRNDDADFYINNTISIVQDAIINDIDVKQLPSIDVKYLLLNQRAKSVGEEIEFTYKEQHQSVNINDFYIANKRDKNDYKVDVGGGYGLIMSELTFEQEIRLSVQYGDLDNKAGMIYKMIIDSVKAIYDDTDMWEVGKQITVEDVEQFITSIPSTNSKPLYDFIVNSPMLAVKIMDGMDFIQVTSRDVDFLSSPSAT